MDTSRGGSGTVLEGVLRKSSREVQVREGQKEAAPPLCCVGGVGGCSREDRRVES